MSLISDTRPPRGKQLFATDRFVALAYRIHEYMNTTAESRNCRRAPTSRFCEHWICTFASLTLNLYGKNLSLQHKPFFMIFLC